MKLNKIMLVFIGVLVGSGIGWLFFTYQANRGLRALKQIYSPEVQEYITQSVKNGELLDDLSEEDLYNLIELSRKYVVSMHSQYFGKASQAYLSMKFLRRGEVDAAIESSESCLRRFVEMHDEGTFKGDVDEELIDKLAEASKLLLMEK